MGQPATVNITVRNGGTCAAGAFGVQWRPDLFGAAQPAVVVAGLAPGASTTANVPFTFPRTGLFLSFTTLDPTNAVPETNEGNNSTITLVNVPTRTDLVVSTLTAYAGSQGGRHGFGGGGQSDYLDGEALLVGEKGQVLARHPQLAVLPSSSGGAWYDPASERRRIAAIAEQYAQWLVRMLPVE